MIVRNTKYHLEQKRWFISSHILVFFFPVDNWLCASLLPPVISLLFTLINSLWQRLIISNVCTVPIHFHYVV